MNNLSDLIFSFQYLVPPSVLDQHKLIKTDYKNFDYRLDKSRGDSSSSIQLLLNEISAATDRTIRQSTKSPLLLLSSGKDSIGLALGLAEAGFSVDTFSLVSDPEEKAFIEDVARCLGHKPSFVFTQDIVNQLDSLSECLPSNSRICLDQALVFMHAALRLHGVGDDTLLIDGMGNDIYFGHLPSVDQTRSYRLYQFFLGRPPSVLDFYARNFLQANGMSTVTGKLIAPSIERFNQRAGDLFKFDSPVFNLQEFVSRRAYVRGLFIDEGVYSEKTRILGDIFGADVVFPWSDSELSDYCFNLPQQSRFNLKSFRNKVLLRDLLFDRLDYDLPKRGIDAYEYISEEVLISMLINASIPDSFIAKISKNVAVNHVVKKRAYFECFIFTCYLNAMGISDFESIFLNGLC